MTEEKSSFSNLMIIGIISSIIGGLIVYYMLKSKTTTPTPPSLSTQSYDNSSLDNRLNTIEQQLYQLQQTQLQQLNQTPQLIQQTPSTQSQQTTYNNSEKTNFILNKDGDIIGMETVRNAKIG